MKSISFLLKASINIYRVLFIITTAILNKLRVLFLRLGKISIVNYIACYLLLIFVFSLIYYNLPTNNFYHSTSQFEYEFLNQDADFILRDIELQIAKEFEDSYGQSRIYFDDWQVDIEMLDIQSLNVKNFPQEFDFSIYLPSYYEKEEDYIEIYHSSKITVTLADRIISNDIVYFFIEVGKSPLASVPFTSVSGERLPAPPELNVLFPNKNFGDGSLTFLPLSLELYDNIVGLGKGYKGFPSQVSGHYWRMLYLSTGVATSTVFGDVVPLTRTARACVIAEAIGAILILGLILNAIPNSIALALKNASRK
jgi:hypothetical protein